MNKYELIVVPDNPLMPSAYPPKAIIEAENEAKITEWFKEAQDAGQYAGCHIHSVKKV